MSGVRDTLSLTFRIRVRWLNNLTTAARPAERDGRAPSSPLHKSPEILRSLSVEMPPSLSPASSRLAPPAPHFLARSARLASPLAHTRLTAVHHTSHHFFSSHLLSSSPLVSPLSSLLFSSSISSHCSSSRLVRRDEHSLAPRELFVDDLSMSRVVVALLALFGGSGVRSLRGCAPVKCPTPRGGQIIINSIYKELVPDTRSLPNPRAEAPGK